uniref:Uncharacterized protein n=1 Tax=Opuntia streptacantha TaxID=393608 RepID=A0A7C9CZM1_OPUST
MALQSAPKLLYTPNSVFSANDRLVFADFVGLSKRRLPRRRLSAAASRRLSSYTAGNFAVSPAIKAVLDLQSGNGAASSRKSSSGQGLHQQWRSCMDHQVVAA